MSTLNEPEGAWSVFAAKVVEERDRLRGVCDLRLHIMERLEKERDEARAQLAEMREEYAHLKHREVMLKRAHGALADAGCVVPIEFDRTIEHAINALAERALTAEERLERVTHERDQERTVFEQENLALRRELARIMDDH